MRDCIPGLSVLSSRFRCLHCERSHWPEDASGVAASEAPVAWSGRRDGSGQDEVKAMNVVALGFAWRDAPA